MNICDSWGVVIFDLDVFPVITDRMFTIAVVLSVRFLLMEPLDVAGRPFGSKQHNRVCIMPQ